MATLLNPRERIQIERAHGDIARMAASTVRREDGCHIPGEGGGIGSAQGNPEGYERDNGSPRREGGKSYERSQFASEPA
jgi:hypothetical protein